MCTTCRPILPSGQEKTIEPLAEERVEDAMAEADLDVPPRGVVLSLASLLGVLEDAHMTSIRILSPILVY